MMNEIEEKILFEQVSPQFFHLFGDKVKIIRESCFLDTTNYPLNSTEFKVLRYDIKSLYLDQMFYVTAIESIAVYQTVEGRCDVMEQLSAFIDTRFKSIPYMDIFIIFYVFFYKFPDLLLNDQITSEKLFSIQNEFISRFFSPHFFINFFNINVPNNIFSLSFNVTIGFLHAFSIFIHQSKNSVYFRALSDNNVFEIVFDRLFFYFFTLPNDAQDIKRKISTTVVNLISKMSHNFLLTHYLPKYGLQDLKTCANPIFSIAFFQTLFKIDGLELLSENTLESSEALRKVFVDFNLVNIFNNIFDFPALKESRIFLSDLGDLVFYTADIFLGDPDCAILFHALVPTMCRFLSLLPKMSLNSTIVRDVITKAPNSSDRDEFILTISQKINAILDLKPGDIVVALSSFINVVFQLYNMRNFIVDNQALFLDTLEFKNDQAIEFFLESVRYLYKGSEYRSNTGFFNAAKYFDKFVFFECSMINKNALYHYIRMIVNEDNIIISDFKKIRFLHDQILKYISIDEHYINLMKKFCKKFMNVIIQFEDFNNLFEFLISLSHCNSIRSANFLVCSMSAEQRQKYDIYFFKYFKEYPLSTTSSITAALEYIETIKKHDTLIELIYFLIKSWEAIFLKEKADVSPLVRSMILINGFGAFPDYIEYLLSEDYIEVISVVALETTPFLTNSANEAFDKTARVLCDHVTNFMTIFATLSKRHYNKPHMKLAILNTAVYLVRYLLFFFNGEFWKVFKSILLFVMKSSFDPNKIDLIFSSLLQYEDPAIISDAMGIFVNNTHPKIMELELGAAYYKIVGYAKKLSKMYPKEQNCYSFHTILENDERRRFHFPPHNKFEEMF